MGILKLISTFFKISNFTPDFTKNEYENFLSFAELGGNSETWETLKIQNNWDFDKFNEYEYERFETYIKESEEVSTKYFKLLEKIQKNWSVMYNLKDFTGELAKTTEKECLEGIKCYKEMKEIDTKYGEETPINVPAFKRLAMLYDKQGRYEEAIHVCKKACSLNVDERPRMIRLIKKAKRKPSQEELNIINKG